MAIVRTINMDAAKKLSSVFILFIEKARGSIEISHFCFLFNYISTCFLNQRYSYRYDVRFFPGYPKMVTKLVRTK